MHKAHGGTLTVNRRH